MIPAHPLAELFPMLGIADAEALRADIAANGLREPIVVLDGQILDGRNRHRAAVAAGVLADELPQEGDALWISHFRRYVPAQDGDPLAWVLSKNLHRRHLTESQRAMVASRLEGFGHGGLRGEGAKQDANLPLARKAAADALHVSPRSVTSAAKVRERGVPELQAKVDAGDIAVSAAADLASLPVGEQVRILQAADPRAFRSVVAAKRRELTEQKKERREQRVVELAGRIAALPDKRYGVILADPEWEHQTWSDGGMHKAAANHYPVSGIDAIKARPVGDIAAQDCVLFLWTTVPHERQAHDVLEAWGFAYKSQAIWLKRYPGERQGLGYWFRINHEILLVGTRGKVPAPAPGTQWGSVIEAPVGEHSAKPEIFHDLIESLYGALPKIELNARRARPGWDVWGLEAPGGVPGGEGPAENAASLASGRTGAPAETHAVSEGIAMSFAEAEPVLRAHYATKGGDELAAMIGRPVGTVRTWAHRLGLTDRSRIVLRGAGMVAGFNARRGVAP